MAKEAVDAIAGDVVHDHKASRRNVDPSKYQVIGRGNLRRDELTK